MAWGNQAVAKATRVADKFYLSTDPKFVEWSHESLKLIKEARITFIYGLLFYTFNKNATNKTDLRDDIQKLLKVFRSEFKFEDKLLLPVVLDNIASAMKFKYAPP